MCAGFSRWNGKIVRFEKIDRLRAGESSDTKSVVGQKRTVLGNLYFLCFRKDQRAGQFSTRMRIFVELTVSDFGQYHFNAVRKVMNNYVIYSRFYFYQAFRDL